MQVPIRRARNYVSSNFSAMRFRGLKAWCASLLVLFKMPAPAKDSLLLLRKRVNTCRTHMLKEQQKLSKLRWDLGTVAYKQHALELEVIFMAGINGFAPLKLPFSKNSLKGKCLTLRKLLLKEQQKLAKKHWEYACCNAKKDALDLLTEA